MLLIDYSVNEYQVIVLLPKEETIRICPLNSFKVDQLMLLNGRLRECLRSTSFSSQLLTAELMCRIKQQLKI